MSHWRALALAMLVSGCVPLARSSRPLPPEASDLPIISVEAAIARTPDPRFVVWISGDGGWGNMERETSALLAESGVPTAGINSLRYFWARRTPEETADAIDRIVRAFGQRWGRERFVLVGFSFGADIAPLVAERLSPDVRSRLISAVFLSPSMRASYEVGPDTWFGMGGEDDVEHVIEGLDDFPRTCARGARDAWSACPRADAVGLHVAVLPGGHNLNGDWPQVARLILDAPNP